MISKSSTDFRYNETRPGGNEGRKEKAMKELWEESSNFEKFEAKGGTWDEFVDFLMCDFLGKSVWEDMNNTVHDGGGD